MLLLPDSLSSTCGSTAGLSDAVAAAQATGMQASHAYEQHTHEGQNNVFDEKLNIWAC